MRRVGATEFREMISSPPALAGVSFILFMAEAYMYLAVSNVSAVLSLLGSPLSPTSLATYILRASSLLLYFIGIASRNWRPAKYYGLVLLTLSMITGQHALPSSLLLKLLAVMLVRDTFFPLYLSNIRESIAAFSKKRESYRTIVVVGKRTLVGVILVVLGYVALIEFIGYIVAHASTVISQAVGVLEEPLASFWNTFLETRVGYVLALITVIALLLVALDMIMSTILYALTVTRRAALEEAQIELKKWFADLRDWKTWHQRMIVESGSIVVGLLLYPVFYLALLAALDAFELGNITGIKYLPTIVSIAFYVLAWGLMRRYLRNVLAIGKGALKPPSFRTTAIIAGFTIVFAAYLYIYDPTVIHSLARGDMPGSDPLSRYWNDRYAYIRIKDVVEGLDAAGRILIKLFWG